MRDRPGTITVAAEITVSVSMRVAKIQLEDLMAQASSQHEQECHNTEDMQTIKLDGKKITTTEANESNIMVSLKTWNMESTRTQVLNNPPWPRTVMLLGHALPEQSQGMRLLDGNKKC